MIRAPPSFAYLPLCFPAVTTVFVYSHNLEGVSNMSTNSVTVMPEPEPEHEHTTGGEETLVVAWYVELSEQFLRLSVSAFKRFQEPDEFFRKQNQKEMRRYVEVPLCPIESFLSPPESTGVGVTHGQPENTAESSS